MVLAPLEPPLSPNATETSHPLTAAEQRKQEAEALRASIEKFVEGVMSEKYTLAELLNESFSMDMFELLLKRMTSRLRAILFSRQNTLEFIRIALNPTHVRHTRAMATSFIVLGGAISSSMPCDPNAHKCSEYWDTIFDQLQREADGVSSVNASKQQRAERRASVAELEQIIQVEVNEFEKHGAKSLHQSFVDLAKEEAEDKAAAAAALKEWNKKGSGVAEYDNSLNETDDRPRSPSSPRSSIGHEDELEGDTADLPPIDEQKQKELDDVPAPSMTLIEETATFGIFSADSANFVSQILRYFAIRGQKGACILHFLSLHPGTVDLLLSNIGHDDVRTLLLHLVYSDHSEPAIASLFSTHMMQKLIQQQVTFAPPRTAFERDCIENTCILLREIIHAPYLTARGVAISAKTIPLDKVTGQDEYVSICGASREMANSSLRKYTSRKVRRLIHLFMTENQKALEQLFMQMIKELTFWSTSLAPTRERRGSITSLESMQLLSQGHPRPTCTIMLKHLFELTETVDFTDEAARRGGVGNSAATAVGIDCLNFMCSTHLMKRDKILFKKKLKNEVQHAYVSLNCMLGLKITSLREGQSSNAHDTGFTQNQGNQTIITLDEIESVQSCDWHKYGFSVSIKKKPATEKSKSSNSSALGTYNESSTHHDAHDLQTVEYFAANSDAERQAWIRLLEEVISGDLNELEIFCSDDWRSNVREYRRLRECLITCMERKGHELMVFLKQIMVFNTRKTSDYHLLCIVKCLYAVLSNESKRLDRMFVSAHVINTLITCYEKYPMWNLLLSEITKMLIFCIGDFKSKRSRKCPIIGRLLLSEGPDAKLFPLLTKAFIGDETENGISQLNNRQRAGGCFAGTDTLSNLKMVMESLKLCYKEPRTRSQQRIQSILKTDPKWQRVLSASEALLAKHPSFCIAAIPTPPSASTNSKNLVPGTPTPPAFQEDIINQISRPSYSSAHGFGSSFLLGDGCAFGYLFKERQGGREWQKALMVYEYVSYKLWYFYPSEVDETHRIKWKWIVPLSVRTRYTHGHDETHSPVGHHGLFITAYDHQSESDPKNSSTREMHFSVTKLEDRDLWKDVLSKAATTIQQLCRDYSNMSMRMKKKPDKKTVTHCQDPSCKAPFKLFRRPHSCKRCGKWMCGKCTQQRLEIPECGMLTPVRHCRSCFEAAGGSKEDDGPANLFRLSSSRDSSFGTFSGEPTIHGVDGDLRNSFTNAELYELAHGMVSPRTLLQMNRRMQRQNSIDSPTGYLVDEADSFGTANEKENVDYEAEEDLSPLPSPISRRSLLHPTEDIRG